MGYFNFYIIRQLLKNKKIKKFLLFLIIFIVIIILKNNVFAYTDVEFEYNNITYNVRFPNNNDLPYKMITFASNYQGYPRFNLYSSQAPFTLTYTEPNGTPTLKINVQQPVYYQMWYSKTNYFYPVSTTGYNGESGSEETVLSRIAWCLNTLSYTKNGQTIVVNPPPENYDNLPMFLNDKQSIITGGQSLVIMPRRFFKHKNNLICYSRSYRRR